MFSDPTLTTIGLLNYGALHVPMLIPAHHPIPMDDIRLLSTAPRASPYRKLLAPLTPFILTMPSTIEGRFLTLAGYFFLSDELHYPLGLSDHDANFPQFTPPPANQILLPQPTQGRPWCVAPSDRGREYRPGADFCIGSWPLRYSRTNDIRIYFQ